MHIDPHANSLPPLMSPTDSRPRGMPSETGAFPPVQPVNPGTSGASENRIRTPGDAPERRPHRQSACHMADTQDVQNSGTERHKLDVYA